MQLSVGFLGDQIHKNSDGKQVGDIASIQEFGDINNRIPPRPFMRPTIIENTPEWVSSMIKGVKEIFNNGSDLKEVFNSIGEDAEFEVQSNIRAINTPPLSPFTLKERISRGNFSDKPLIDTGQMIDSVNYEISKR